MGFNWAFKGLKKLREKELSYFLNLNKFYVAGNIKKINDMKNAS